MKPLIVILGLFVLAMVLVSGCPQAQEEEINPYDFLSLRDEFDAEIRFGLYMGEFTADDYCTWHFLSFMGKYHPELDLSYYTTSYGCNYLKNAHCSQRFIYAGEAKDKPGNLESYIFDSSLPDSCGTDRSQRQVSKEEALMAAECLCYYNLPK